ncbi:MAG: hypothetical protein ACLFU6_05200 [Candidatus Hydrogenedentota bacterium]
MRRRAIVRGWRGFALAAVVFVLLVWGDAWLKAGTHMGFKPPEAGWVLETRDFPAFWATAEGGPVFDALRQELSQPLHRFELIAYEAAGMRPTPYRWEAWLGSSAMMAGEGDRVGISVRPGLLLRVASAFHRLLPGTEAEGGIHAYRGFYYAWRDGFLIASTSLDYVREALETSPVQLPPRHESPRLVWRSETGPNPFRFEIAAHDDLPAEGWVQAEIESRDRPLEHNAAALPEPMAVLTATQWEDLATFVRAFAPNVGEHSSAVPVQDALEDTLHQWRLGELEEDWDATLGQTTVLLHDVERYGLIPMPHAAFIGEEYQTRAPTHPLEPLFDDFTPIPYQWGPAEGTMYPFWSGVLSPCLARSGRYWVAASRERLMPHLVDGLPADTYTQADLELWLNWSATGDMLTGFLPEWGRHGLIPGADEGDVQRDYVPYANALARLGSLRITGRMHDNRLELQGQLIGAPGAAESQEDAPDS